jgi:hypothetical protein
MNNLDILDLLYYGHSCSDCDQELFCAQKTICEDWKQQTAETRLVKNLSASMGIPAAYIWGNAANEVEKKIDEFVIKKATNE